MQWSATAGTTALSRPCHSCAASTVAQALELGMATSAMTEPKRRLQAIGYAHHDFDNRTACLRHKL